MLTEYDRDEWRTPPVIVSLACNLMGGIDCDPATCEDAQQVINAHIYYTKAANGLIHPWIGRLWLNPPYSMPLIEHFVHKLLSEINKGNTTQAVVIVNNATETNWYKLLSNYLIPAHTRRRIQFYHPDYKGTQNRQGQTIFYYGSEWEKFYQIFNAVAYPPMALIRALKSTR